MKRGRFWLISGLLLIAAALCLIGYNLLDAKRADEASAQILRQIEPQIDPDPIPFEGRPVESNPEQTEYPDYAADPNVQMPTAELDGSRYIGALRTGSTVTFTDMDGNTFTYEITEIENLDPKQVREMVTGEWDLTLFTCTLGNESRIAVRCDRLE